MRSLRTDTCRPSRAPSVIGFRGTRTVRRDRMAPQSRSPITDLVQGQRFDNPFPVEDEHGVRALTDRMSAGRTAGSEH